MPRDRLIYVQALQCRPDVFLQDNGRINGMLSIRQNRRKHVIVLAVVGTDLLPPLSFFDNC